MCVTCTINIIIHSTLSLLCVGVSKTTPESGATSLATLPVASDEIKAKIEADVTVVNISETIGGFFQSHASTSQTSSSP